jgi:DNA-binding NarL/FixJ family response regulator
MGEIKILIADDHTVFCECLKKVLEMQEDFKVVGIAKNGPEAVRRAEETLPDVILMDIQMPTMDGIRSTKLIKERLPSASVVILTMHAEDKYVMETIKAGANGYILKDLSVKEVVQAVRSAAMGNYMLTQAAIRKLVEHNTKNLYEDYDLHDKLTKRELEIVSLIAAGFSNKEIANKLFISFSTVKNHISNIFAKLQCSNRAELVNKAIKKQLIQPVDK